MKHVRILVYDGTVEWIQQTLRASLAKGEFKTPMGSITIIENPIIDAVNYIRSYENHFTSIDNTVQKEIENE